MVQHPNMRLLTLLFLTNLFVQAFSTNSSILERKKRWLSFPKGSSLQLVYCFLISTYGTKAGIFTVGFTVGLAWEIPVDVRKYIFQKGKTKVHDRDRRSLFEKIEKFIETQNGQGENCVLKAICETKNRSHQKMSFVHALVSEIFRLENEEFWASHPKYKRASEIMDCHEEYPCKFSMYDNS